jgi:hypothetical protein
MHRIHSCYLRHRGPEVLPDLGAAHALQAPPTWREGDLFVDELTFNNYGLLYL